MAVEAIDLSPSYCSNLNSISPLCISLKSVIGIMKPCMLFSPWHNSPLKPFTCYFPHDTTALWNPFTCYFLHDTTALWNPLHVTFSMTQQPFETLYMLLSPWHNSPLKPFTCYFLHDTTALWNPLRVTFSMTQQFFEGPRLPSNESLFIWIELDKEILIRWWPGPFKRLLCHGVSNI